MMETLGRVFSVLALILIVGAPFYMSSRPRKTKIYDDGTNNLTNDRVSHN